MINLQERMLPTSAELNPRPPGLQSDGASNWATEADLCYIDNWTYSLEVKEYYFKGDNSVKIVSTILKRGLL